MTKSACGDSTNTSNKPAFTTQSNALKQKLFFISGLVILLHALLSASQAVAAEDHLVNSAFKYQQKLANMGYAEAQYRLVEMYQDGVGTSQDSGRAREWYGKSASQGYESAKLKLEQLEYRKTQLEKERNRAAEKAEQTRMAAERKQLDQERLRLKQERELLAK